MIRNTVRILKPCVNCGIMVPYHTAGVPGAKVRCAECKQARVNEYHNAHYDYDKAKAKNLLYKNTYRIKNLADYIAQTLRGADKKYYIVSSATTLLTYENQEPLFIEAPGPDFLKTLRIAASVTVAELQRAWQVKI